MHDPRDCASPKNHCFAHNEDELADAGHPFHRICGECFHVYRSASELLAEHNQVIAELNAGRLTACQVHASYASGCYFCELHRQNEHEPDIPAETDPGRIWVCPLCTHDF